MSQKELADRMRDRGWKWAQATVWKVERGERPLRFLEAIAVCEILDHDLSALVEGEGELLVIMILREAVERLNGAHRSLVEGITDWQHATSRAAEAVRIYEADSPLDDPQGDARARDLVDTIQGLMSAPTEGLLGVPEHLADDADLDGSRFDGVEAVVSDADFRVESFRADAPEVGLSAVLYGPDGSVRRVSDVGEHQAEA